MGLKSVLLTLLCASLAALGFWLVPPKPTPRPSPEATTSAPVPTEAGSAAAAEPGAVAGQTEQEPGGTKALDEGANLEVPAPEVYAEQRIEQLQDLGMRSDTNSLRVILSELTNRDPRVRQAARDAAVQFGSRDAVPALAEAWSQTDDPEEKVALQKAIDFLKLPAWGDLNAQR